MCCLLLAWLPCEASVHLFIPLSMGLYLLVPLVRFLFSWAKWERDPASVVRRFIFLKKGAKHYFCA